MAWKSIIVYTAAMFGVMLYLVPSMTRYIVGNLRRVKVRVRLLERQKAEMIYAFQVVQPSLSSNCYIWSFEQKQIFILKNLRIFIFKISRHFDESDMAP